MTAESTVTSATAGRGGAPGAPRPPAPVPALSLPGFLAAYERAHPEQVVHVEREVSCVQVVTAIVQKLAAEDRYPILVFQRPRLAHGGISRFPLVVNLYASRQRCAEAMGSTFRDVGRDFYRKARLERRPPVVVGRDEAPVKDIVLRGADVNLFDLPALVHHEGDPGPYLTGGFFTHYDPDSGIDNSSLHRGWIVQERALRVYPAANSDAERNLKKYEARGEPMPAAYWIGHHPVAGLGAQVRVAYPGSHLEAAGGLLGAPLRVVPSETLGDNFLVPADAEVVIEGFIEPGKRYPEGPFGEYTGYLGPQVPNPQLTVTAVTHRAGAYWHDIMVGWADTAVMGAFGMEGTLYEVVKSRVPSLKNVYLPLSGRCRFHAYLQLEDPAEGDAREAIMTALPVDRRLKHVFVFDDDVDIFDDREALFAIATRSQWNDDVMIFPGVRGVPLDPSISGRVTTKAGIDCTKPVGKVFAERLQVRADVLDGVDLAAVLGAETLQAIPPERM
ncbi:MAG TPA: UbiD family decarboxylase [Chloroflexota bacterium]|nr:UbiD family decarboxylase [Chloroflexota bacterium]